MKKSVVLHHNVLPWWGTRSESKGRGALAFYCIPARTRSHNKTDLLTDDRNPVSVFKVPTPQKYSACKYR